MNLIEEFFKYGYNPRYYQETEPKRLAFVDEYTDETILNLSQKEYCYAGLENTFCYRIQYELRALSSMGNAFPSVFGVYVDSHNQRKLSKHLASKFGTDYEAALKYQEKQIVSLINAGKEKDYRAIERSDINQQLKFKLLSIFCPDLYFPVCTRPTAEEYCKNFGIKPRESASMLDLNLALVKWSSDNLPDEWDLHQAMYFADWLIREKAMFSYSENALPYKSDSIISNTDPTLKKQLVSFANSYVQELGADDIMEGSDILALAGLSDKAHSIFPADYCYNRYNKALKSFEGPFLFEYIDKGQFKILGENYPYSGPVYHKPQGESERIIGYWTEGKVRITDSEVDWEDVEIQQIETEFQQIEDKVKELHLEGTEKMALVKTRINQSFFRDKLLRKYGKCCLCGVDEKSLLVASHIKPWAVSTPKERTETDNGLLLCPDHDKLFDQGYITFAEDGKIIISPLLTETNRIFLNVNPDMVLKMSDKTKAYMEYHRENIFKDK